MRARWKRLDAAITMLESDPDEPNANYVVGLQCFQEQRWNDGVRHLARAANHAAVASVAAGDLRGAVGPASFIALAEDWKRVAQSSSELTPLLHRSLYWMHRAIPKKEGEERRALESEVAAIRKELVRWSSQPAIPTAQTRQREPGKNAASNVTMKAAGQRIHTFSAHPGGVHAIRFCDRLKVFATCGEDGKILVWSIESRRPIFTLESHAGPVRDIAFSPDGKLLASVGDDKTLQVWRLPKSVTEPSSDAALTRRDQGAGRSEMAKPAIFHGHTTGLRGVAFSADGTTIATCADDRRVAFWSVKSGVPIVRQQHQGIIYDIAASPTGALMATVGEDRFVRIWRGSVASPPLVGHLGKVLAVAISAKGLIASGGERNTIFLWDLHKGARSVARSGQGHRGIGVRQQERSPGVDYAR